MKDPLKNTKHFGRYELIHPLGRGGMGIVYLASDPKLSRQVAIKCVEKQSTETTFAKRLRSEARMMAQLNHRNIVQLYDVIENDDVLGLVIEYVEGVTLLDKCREQLPDYRTRLKWLIQIAEGLATAHDAGIAHCDLKLGNILVANTGIVKIADFGIAKARFNEKLKGGDLTEFENVSGSYFSLSPEQAMGKKVDFRTDLFSFGIVSHILLTGQHPFGKTKNHLVIIQRIINDEFALNSDTKKTLSSGLVGLISILLKKNPKQRPANARAVINSLRHELNEIDGLDAEPEDLTIEIPSTQSNGYRSYLKEIVLTSVALVLSATLVLWWLTPSIQQQYVAVIRPIVTVPKGFDADKHKRISTTIEQSLQEALLSFEGLSLISNANLEQYGGDPVKLATARGADFVILASADCTITTCEINIQKSAGDQHEVLEQKTWPAITESLSDIRTTTFAELSSLFPERAANENSNNVAISEADYRTYIQIHQSSFGGNGATEDQLSELELLIEKTPYFVSAYILYGKAAILLYKSTAEQHYLDNLSKLLTNTNPSIKKNRRIKKVEFELFLAQGKLIEAAEFLEEQESIIKDRVFINDLKGSLAYANNDYATVLKLDIENSSLRPTAPRFYNLAISYYQNGDLNSAKKLQKKRLLYTQATYHHMS